MVVHYFNEELLARKEEQLLWICLMFFLLDLFTELVIFSTATLRNTPGCEKLFKLTKMKDLHIIYNVKILQ